MFFPKSWNKIIRLTDKLGPDHLYECVGLSSTFTTALDLIKKGGLITLIGLHARNLEINNILSMTANNISVRGIYGYNQDIFKTSINLYAQKKIRADPLITSRIRIEQVPEMFKVLGNPPHDELKVIVDFE